jgi:ferredoxin--NADP+ reductase
LAYRDYLTEGLPKDEFLGEPVTRQLKYYPTVTREPFRTQGRITTLIESGQMARDLALSALNPKTDRAMICGSWDMLKSVKDVLVKRGFNEGNTTKPGDFVVERAFVDQ